MIKVVSKATAPFLPYDLKIEEKRDDLILREILDWVKDKSVFHQTERDWIVDLLERIEHRSMMANSERR